VLGPLVLTIAFERSVNADGYYFPGAIFLVAAVLIAAIVPLVWRLRAVEREAEA